MRLTLCLLTWNELEGSKLTVPSIPLDIFEEVFAIDGGSTDGTVEYLASQGITVHAQQFPTYNGAYRSAFVHCTTDAVVFYHPKGSISPDILEQFRGYFESGYALVIASRMAKGGANEEDVSRWRPRKWFVLGLGAVSAALWRRQGPIIWDVLHGCRGMRADAFAAIEPLEKGVTIDLEMVVRCYRIGLRAVEFPVCEKARAAGQTHFKAWPTGKRMLRYLLQELRRPRPQQD